MSRIVKAIGEIKRKLTFSDYRVELPEKKAKARKLYMLSQKDMVMLEEIFEKRASLVPIADIMSEAIQLLHMKEFNHS